MDAEHINRIRAIRDGIDEAESIGALSFIQSSNMAYLCRMLEYEMTDAAALVTALRDLEHAVNRSVSGMRVDVSEWLALLRQARAVLGDRVKE